MCSTSYSRPCTYRCGDRPETRETEQSMNKGEEAEQGPIEDDARVEDSPSVEEQLAEALREKEDFRVMGLRARADLENYRKRASEEREEARRSASTAVLLKLLSVMDDFERAMALVPDDAVAPGWLEGLQLVHKGMSTLLESEGVSRIEAAGNAFDPHESEAILYQESTSAADGEVISVIREGYRQRDRVLRPAQVIVAKRVEEDSEESENEESEVAE